MENTESISGAKYYINKNGFKVYLSSVKHSRNNYKKWRENNPEKFKQYCKQYNEKNKERIRKRSSEYYKNNKEKILNRLNGKNDIKKYITWMRKISLYK
jgi:hypothetical protein